MPNYDSVIGDKKFKDWNYRKDHTVYFATGKRVDNSFEYQALNSKGAPQFIFFNKAFLNKYTTKKTPKYNFGDVEIPEYVAITYSATMPV